MQQPAIGFVGDSLTYGLYATSQADSYTQLVATALQARAVVQGISGVAAASLDSETPLPQGVGTVVVELGTNDFDQPIGAFARGYGALIDRMQAAAPGATFICLGIWRGSTDRSARTGLPPAVFDQAIQHACPGRFVSLTPIYMDATVHGPAGRPTWRGVADRFHPNDEGHRQVADSILRALQTRPELLP